MTIDIGKEFYHRLVNRDKNQGDGAHTALQFREKFLQDLGNQEWWDDSSKWIELDFGNVRTLGPSWANEVFAYYTQFSKPDAILKKIRLKNVSAVKLSIIKNELDSGYSR